MTASDPDRDELAELIRDQEQRIATFHDSMAHLQISGEADGVRAVFGTEEARALREFTVAPQTLARCSSSELASIIKTVLADTHQRFKEQFWELFTDMMTGLGFGGTSDYPAVSSGRHVESSHSGDLVMSFDDRCVVVDVYLAPAVVSTWTAQQVGERVQDMYTAALLDAVARNSERFAAATPGAELPSTSEVTEFRRRYLDF